jgi:hypothetical protein
MRGRTAAWLVPRPAPLALPATNVPMVPSQSHSPAPLAGSRSEGTLLTAPCAPRGSSITCRAQLGAVRVVLVTLTFVPFSQWFLLCRFAEYWRLLGSTRKYQLSSVSFGLFFKLQSLVSDDLCSRTSCPNQTPYSAPGTTSQGACSAKKGAYAPEPTCTQKSADSCRRFLLFLFLIGVTNGFVISATAQAFPSAALNPRRNVHHPRCLRPGQKACPLYSAAIRRSPSVLTGYDCVDIDNDLE